MDLPHSEDCFVVAFPAENTEAFLEGHNQAFAYFGGSADSVIMHQDAFAPMLGSNEIFLLGKAIKYAGLAGKEVRIIPSAPQPL
jgi:hypothetical protein